MALERYKVRLCTYEAALERSDSLDPEENMSCIGCKQAVNAYGREASPISAPSWRTLRALMPTKGPVLDLFTYDELAGLIDEPGVWAPSHESRRGSS